MKKYLDKGNDAKWKLFFNIQLRDLGNVHKKDLSPYFKASDVFLQEILQAWSSIVYEAKNYSKKQLNYLFRVNNKPIHYIAWSSRGKQNIVHLMELFTKGIVRRRSHYYGRCYESDIEFH